MHSSSRGQAPTSSPGSHLHLLHELQRQLDEALRPLLSNASSVALLDFPDFSNVGDSAIWLGALATLRRLGAPAPCHSCDARSYDRKTLARRIGDGVILLNGGGNFGDLWPRHQLFRERLVADFPDNPIIALPQSMHFVDPRATERAQAAFAAHRRLTLLLRDRESHVEATRLFGDVARLVPDVAFGLPPLQRTHAASVDVLWLKRDDQEDRWSAGHRAEPGDVICDWAGDEDSRLVRAHDALVRATRRTTTSRLARNVLTWLHPRLAQQRMDRGVDMLSRGHVVITDRLHGHILCMLLGIPHVVLDNSYGKLSRFISAWTAGSALVTLAESPDDARAIAGKVISDGV